MYKKKWNQSLLIMFLLGGEFQPLGLRQGVKQEKKIIRMENTVGGWGQHF